MSKSKGVEYIDQNSIYTLIHGYKIKARKCVLKQKVTSEKSGSVLELKFFLKNQILVQKALKI